MRNLIPKILKRHVFLIPFAVEIQTRTLENHKAAAPAASSINEFLLTSTRQLAGDSDHGASQHEPRGIHSIAKQQYGADRREA